MGYWGLMGNGDVGLGCMSCMGLVYRADYSGYLGGAMEDLSQRFLW
jgi:hypothetical protein